jgi:RNA polymerase sigma-70 factor (ECF subfamily)
MGDRVADARPRIIAWVGSEILPHERDLRAWLRRTVGPGDVEDVVQEAYCRISALNDVVHIRSGRAYLFTTARMLVLERIRRARVVSIEAVANVDALPGFDEDPSAERVIDGRRELARVQRLIDALPERCRAVFRLRKIEGLSQREVAQRLGLPEHSVENDVAKGLRLILKAIAEGEQAVANAIAGEERDERARDSRRDR